MRKILLSLISVFALALPAKAFVNVTWNGVTYAIPESGDLNWSSLTTFLQALGNNAGVAKQMKQAVRVATTTPVTVSATADFTVVTKLSVPAAVAVNLPAGIDGQVFLIIDGNDDASTNNVTITPAAGTIGGGATLVLDHNGESVLLQYHAATTDWKVLINSLKPGTIVGSDISSSAAIARSKLASGSNDHVVINNGSGVMTSEATLAKSRGGSGQDNSSLTFPATGTLATLAGTEAFTNKTLTAGLFDSYVDYGHISTPVTPSAGRIRVYAKSDNNLYRVDPNGVEQKIGSGAASNAETNYITNPSAVADLTGWTLVNSGLSFARTTTAANLPRENTTGTGISILGTAGTEAATDYVYFPFTLDDVDAGAVQRVLQIKWDQKIIGSYADGLLAVTITDESNNLVATPVVSAIPASDGTFGTTFVTTSTQAVRLKIAATAAIGTGDGIVISNVVVGPGTLVQGPPISDWISYTPVITETGSKGTTSLTGKYRLVGDSMEVAFQYQGDATAAGAGAGVVTVSLPSGFSIDTNKLPSSIITFDTNVLGIWTDFALSVAGQYSDAKEIFVASSTSVRFAKSGTNSSITRSDLDIARSAQIQGRFTVPIVGQSSGVYLGSGADNAVSALNLTPFVPTLSAGWTGQANQQFWYQRDKDSIRIVGSLTFTGVDSVVQTISLPSGFLIDTNKLASTFRGRVGRFEGGVGSALISSTDHEGVIFSDGSDTSNLFFAIQSSSDGYVKNQGGQIFAAAGWVSIDIIVPVQGLTAQDYLGKILTGFALATNSQPGLIGNPSNMSDGIATALGLKQYVAGTNYNGGVSPTVTGANTWSTNRAVFVPYQSQDGAWRLRFNIVGTVAGGSRTAEAITVNGVTFKNVSNYFQAFTGFPVDANINAQICYASPNAGTLTITHETGTTTAYQYSGDVELESKPTWAY